MILSVPEPLLSVLHMSKLLSQYAKRLKPQRVCLHHVFQENATELSSAKHKEVDQLLPMVFHLDLCAHVLLILLLNNVDHSRCLCFFNKCFGILNNYWTFT